MTSDTGRANVAIEQVLELSEDAHIERSMTAQDSAAFHRLTGAIAAYGQSALSSCRPRTAGRVLRHDCAPEPARAGSIRAGWQYVGEERSGMQAADGEEKPHRHCALPLRKVCLERLKPRGPEQVPAAGSGRAIRSIPAPR